MNCNRVGFVARVINYLLRETKIMTTIEEIQADAQETLDALTLVDAKLDEVRNFIAGLEAGQPVPEETLAAIKATLGQAKEKAQSVLSEADALDEPATPPAA